MKVLVLTDLECPACRAFHSTLGELQRDHPGMTSIWYLQHPLTYHRAALPAARAAECAAATGQFRAFVDEVFQEQQALENARWANLALAAGIADTARIVDCAEADSVPLKIREGLRVGAEIALRGTPTVLVNGWQFHDTPSLRELELALEALTAGKRPRALSRR